MRPMCIVSREQGFEIVGDLLKFIHRVALDKNASPAEIAVLPEIAKLLFWLSPLD